MLRTKLPKIVIVYFVLAGLEALFFAIYLLFLPTDPKNTWIGGYSTQRLIIVGAFLFTFIFFEFLAYQSNRETTRIAQFVENILNQKQLVRGGLFLSIFMFLIGFSIITVKPIWILPNEQFYTRIQTIIIWTMLVAAQTTIGLFYYFLMNKWGSLIQNGRRLSWTNIFEWLRNKWGKLLQGFCRLSWTYIILWLLIGVISLSTALYYQGSNSPWIKFGVPFNNLYFNNPIYGYNIVYNGDFLHKENLYPFRQMDMLKGDEVFSPIFTDKRIFYAFVGNILTLLFNSYYALLFLNFILFILSAVLLYRFTETLFKCKYKSFLASFLFSLSIMGVTHLGDTSPHIMAIFFYYLWALLLLKIIKRDQTISMRENIGLLAILCLWSLTYPGSFYGLIIYLLVLIKQRKYIYIILTTLLFYIVPSLQIGIISSLQSISIHGGITQIANEPGMVETSLAQNMIYKHIQRLLTSPVIYLKDLLFAFIDLLFIDNPINVLISAVGIIFLKTRQKWYLSFLLFIPILTSLFFFMQSASRGYMAAGASIVVYAVTAHFVVEWAKILQRKLGTWSIVVLLMLVLGSQAAWAHASAFKVMFPAYAYGFGPSQTVDSVNMPRFVRYTGNLNDLPRLVYGTETINKYLDVPPDVGKQPVFANERRDLLSGYRAGRVKFLNNFRETYIELLIGLYVQAIMVFLVLMILFIFIQKPLRNYALALFSFLILATLLFSSSTGLDKSSYINIDRTIALATGEELRGEIHLSEAFVRLLKETGNGRKVTLFMNYLGTDNSGFSVYDISSRDPGNNSKFINIDLKQFLSILDSHNNIIAFSIFAGNTKGSAALISSWQKNRSGEGRHVEKVDATGDSVILEWFPNLEIRIVDGPIYYGFATLPSLEIIGY
jgi:hypothetical protein